MPSRGVLEVYMMGGGGGGGAVRRIFSGLEIYTLSIFFGSRDLSHIFLGLKNTLFWGGLISERTFRFRFSLSVKVEQKGG